MVTGIAVAAGAAVAFGTMAIFAKYAHREGADSLPLLAARFAIAALLLRAVSQIVRCPVERDRGKVIRLMLLGGLGYSFEASLFFVALEHAPAGVVSLVFYSYPLWVTLLGLATGLEPFRGRVLVALALGSAGVVLIFSLPEGGLAGPLLAGAAAVAVAVYFVLAQVVARGIDAYSAATWTVTGAACALAIPSLATGQSLPASALPYAGALGLATAVAFIGLYAALELIGSTRASVAMMLEPVATVLLAALLLNEELTLRIGVAAVLIVAALPILAASGGPGLDSALAELPAESEGLRRETDGRNR